MAQTPDGARKAAAARLGISLEEYKTREAHEKWCTPCKAWHPRSAFNRDGSRSDGLSTSCRVAQNERGRSKYNPKARPKKGRNFVPARDGDKHQARRRINYFVEAGILPHPNRLPCHDCGHRWVKGGKRHEYDHYLGYAAVHHEDVQVVCSACHHKREATNE